MIPYDAILCDFDGVLRHHDLSVQADIERRYGMASGTLLGVALAPEVVTPAILGRITEEEWRAAIAEALGGDERARRIAAEFAEVPSWIDEEVRSLLAKAQEHVPIVLVTNATTKLEEDLERLGLAYFADAVVSSARVGVAKPDRRIFEIAAKEAGAAPERCLFVDDSPANVEAARALGMTGVHFTSVADLATALRLG
ncbi:HAD family hydrolase [Thermoactinospora rubra]|uniref:HAD family hydrolase n=1 Tax=Thermoactinospora rubra TaxID=1088767 RepID=UPI001F0B717C|nr:HAD family phosphatase [Thermoactinospora rubra]